MNDVIDTLLRVGLLLGVIGAIGQLVVMILGVFVRPGISWYWAGSIAYFAAPVAFALTLRLLGERPIREVSNA